jgi:hypothetical protein
VVLGLAHLYAEALEEAGGHAAGELGVGVDAGADRRAAEGYLGKVRLGFLDPLYAALYLAGVAPELLAEADGGGVLEVGAAGLDDVVELDGLLFEGRLELFEGRKEVPFDGDEGREVDGGRDHVVGRLPHVDVVVGVDGRLGAELAVEQLYGAVGDYLVGVHVGGGA